MSTIRVLLASAFALSLAVGSGDSAVHYDEYDPRVALYVALIILLAAGRWMRSVLGRHAAGLVAGCAIGAAALYAEIGMVYACAAAFGALLFMLLAPDKFLPE